MRRLLCPLILSILLAALWPVPVAAQPERHIEVVQVEGAIDPVVAGLVATSLRRAQGSGATVVILQINSSGAMATDPLPLLEAVTGSAVPVAAWVGPARSSARGAAAALVVAAHVGALSSRSAIGPALPLRLDDIDWAARQEDRALVRATGQHPAAGPVATGRFQGREALDAGVADLLAPTLGDLIVALDGRTVQTAAGEVRLSTTRVVQTDEGPRQTANQPVRFRRLSTPAAVQHSLMSPAVAYLLLVVGLALLVFEFFTLGVGLASLTGAAALTGAFFGFSHLPVNWWAVGLVALSAFGFAVDVQAGRRGFWTGVGIAALLAGSVFLYGGSPLLDLPWWLIALGVAGQTLFMLAGMTVAVRNRFSVPTVGREAMVGEVGEARTDLDPEGVVVVRGAPWRARTRRGRPVSTGGAVRVVAVEQLVLEVEADGAGQAE